MDKEHLNYVIDMGLLISFLIVIVTGIIKFRALMNIFGLDYSSLPMKLFSVWHDWAGLVMVVLVLVHLILHWRWIVIVTKDIFKSKKKR
ncbi:DUF4405 domain-containing protein [Candidatus Woesearchaeota archaeon]|nr:DUF4405 domain-containing protein [Candidatus Woesearchaeota archaeon]